MIPIWVGTITGFFGKHLLNWKVLLGILISILVMYGYFEFRKFQGLREKLEIAETAQKKLEQEIIQYQMAAKNLILAQKKTSELLEKEQRALSDLKSTLERKGKKSFKELVQKKPKLIENIIVSGTEKTLRCLEIASGAKRNASDPVCP